MRPVETEYKVAVPGGAFNRLYALARKIGQPLKAGTLNWPTVFAERDGKVLGFLSTTPRTEFILSGPLVMEQPKLLLAIRLGEAYDVVMRAANIPQYFITAPAAMSEWVEILETLGFQRIKEIQGEVLLRRVLT
jgi:hypothetical protein